jgi:trans-aconitate 2-methyltransferase
VSGEGCSAPARDWDAATYDRVSDPQFQWALEQLERLMLDGDEVVLDAGCGSGRVTAELVRRVPRGRVYGVDVAPSMVAHASARLGASATILLQDLQALSLPEPVDVIFSNATFHWIEDHDALFAALRRGMSQGGRLVAQCGGVGNIEAFRGEASAVAREEPFAAHFAGWRDPWHYAGTETTTARLKAAGFDEVRTWLAPKRVEAPRSFIETVCLLPHLKTLPPELGSPFVERLLQSTGEPVTLDYVRLNMTARASGTAR